MTLLEILSYPRAHDSKGEATFIADLLTHLEKDLHFNADRKLEVDRAGNIWYHVGDIKENPYLFVAHIDTLHSIHCREVKTHLTSDGYLRLVNQDEAGCLGADDGVGIYCNLQMIEKGVQGSYLFTRGEEAGLIGASYITDHTPEALAPYILCVEVDRRGTKDIVVEQCTGKGASDKFAQALANLLDMGHEINYNGVFTDNAVFNTEINECVNIAAGYDRQHGPKERLVFQYALDLADRMCRIDWSKLPIKRDTDDLGGNAVGYGWYGHMGYGGTYGHTTTPHSTSDLTGYVPDEDDDYDTGIYDNKQFDKCEAFEYVYNNPEKVSQLLYSLGISRADVWEAWINSQSIPF